MLPNNTKKKDLVWKNSIPKKIKEKKKKKKKSFLPIYGNNR